MHQNLQPLLHEVMPLLVLVLQMPMVTNHETEKSPLLRQIQIQQINKLYVGREHACVYVEDIQFLFDVFSPVCERPYMAPALAHPSC